MLPLLSEALQNLRLPSRFYTHVYTNLSVLFCQDDDAAVRGTYELLLGLAPAKAVFVSQKYTVFCNREDTRLGAAGGVWDGRARATHRS